MDFNKIVSEMRELQQELDVYKIRNNKFKDLLTKLVKEHAKLEKKLSKETDLIQKLHIQLGIGYLKRMISDIETVYKEASVEIEKLQSND